MVNVMEVSKWFLANNSQVASATRLGNVKLQKLLYYSKAMYYAVYDQKLFSNRFEAWENGPVVAEAYREYRYSGLPEMFKKTDCPSLDMDVEKVLKVVNYVYGSQTSNSLIDLTHEEEPWKELETQVELRLNPIISDEKIKTYYSSMKDIYELIDEEEIDNTVFENINGNIFSYDKRETTIEQEEYPMLMAYGEHSKDNSYAIYRDQNNELVVY